MEEWRDIEGYEGLYQISNEGRVKSLNYHRRSGEEKIMKARADRYGYMYISLCENGKHKTHKVHRLVANAFIPNPDNLPQVNHKDEDKTNNNIVLNSDGSIDEDKSNLEWVTAKENSNYGSHGKKIAEALSIPIDMLTKQGEFIRQFPSAKEAEIYLCANGFPKVSRSHICNCCKGKRKTHCGFKWEYTKKELPS